MCRTLLGDPWVCHVYYGAIGTLGEGCAHRTPLGDDPWVCHGAIGTLGEGCARRTPLGDPRIYAMHVYIDPYAMGIDPYTLMASFWVGCMHSTQLGDP